MFNYLKRYLSLIFLALLVGIRLFTICGWKVADALNCQIFQKPSGSALQGLPFAIGNKLNDYIYKFRLISSESVRKYIPSPHSELLLGLTLGINDVSKTPTFNDVLRTTGTIHVVVVSGYNISLVFGFVISILGSQYKIKPLLFALILTLIYAVISGFDPPVIRAWFMGAIASFITFHGRRVPVADILVFSALVMALIDPLYLFSLSFQLSFLAAFGLVYYSDIFSFVAVFFKNFLGKVAFFSEDLVATLSAQVFVWPLISYKFEQVSLISPMVNALILWTTPLATILGSIFVFVAMLSSPLAKLFAYLVIVPLDIFVRGCYLFAKFPFALVTYKPPLSFLVSYFLIALMLPPLITKYVKMPIKHVSA